MACGTLCSGAACALAPFAPQHPHPTVANHQVKSTPEAPKAAAERLARMGPMRGGEKVVLATLSGAVLLWVSGRAGGG